MTKETALALVMLLMVSFAIGGTASVFHALIKADVQEWCLEAVENDTPDQ